MAQGSHVLIAVGIVLLIGVPRIAHSAEVAVLSDGPLESALTQTADAFHRRAGILSSLRSGFPR